MLNITDGALRSGVMVYEKAFELFDEPDKWDRREMVKALTPVFERDVNVRKVVIGLYINDGFAPSGEEVEPFLAIGIRSDNFDKYVAASREGLRPRFKKGAQFEFYDLDSGEETAAALEGQGLVIIDRKGL